MLSSHAGQLEDMYLLVIASLLIVASAFSAITQEEIAGLSQDFDTQAHDEHLMLG